MMTYESAAEELERRIYDLIPDHPEVLALGSCWGLFKVPGFYCDDLQPTMAQASWAHSHAVNRWKLNQSRGYVP